MILVKNLKFLRNLIFFEMAVNVMFLYVPFKREAFYTIKMAF